MGNLTTFTIHCDGIDAILEDSGEFCEKLFRAAVTGETSTFGHGQHHASLVKVQATRHADDPTVYVHMGNTVCEMNMYSRETEELMHDHPKFFKDMLNYMRKQVDGLERQFEQYQRDTTQI